MSAYRAFIILAVFTLSSNLVAAEAGSKKIVKLFCESFVVDAPAASNPSYWVSSVAERQTLTEAVLKINQKMEKTANNLNIESVSAPSVSSLGANPFATVCLTVSYESSLPKLER